MKTKVTFIGAGYVGIVNALGMANRGVEVWLVDNNESRIEQLKDGISPIYEVDIDKYLGNPMVDRNMHYTTDLEEALRNTDYVFIAVGTPQLPDGSADLSAVYAVAKAIGQKVSHSMTVVMKSTVPVGITKFIEIMIDDELSIRSRQFMDNLEKEHGEDYIKEHPEIFKESPMNIDIGVADNPEFLKEGSAFNDFNNPDRIVIGTHYKDDDIREKMYDLYTGMGFGKDIIFSCSIESAELIKYASNSMLAMRISFANMMANMCIRTGADIDDVMTGMGMDKRIGKDFLKAGIGYGGSCFPKDVSALRYQMNVYGVESSLLDATRSINYNAKQRPFHLLLHTVNNMDNTTIAVWGGAFKAGTDDIRESPFLDLIHNLRMFTGVTIKVYDQLAKENIRKFVADPVNHDEFVGNLNIVVVDNIMDSVKDANAILVMTPTVRHKNLDFKSIKEHTGKERPFLIDCRNFYDYDDIRKISESGFVYVSVGCSLKWLRQK